MNPEYLIKNVEIGTSKLEERIEATNKMYKAGYHVGINIAPIILVDNYQELYEGLLKNLAEKLEPQLKQEIFFELIFLTFGLANEKINGVAMKNVLNVFDREKMRGRGRGKYCYKKEYREEAQSFFIQMIKKYFEDGEIKYIV
jgi:spore photoproduct lyase